MDRIFSARVNETIIRTVAILAKQLGTTKKAVIERAIIELAEKIEIENNIDLLAATAGTWAREESIDTTIERSRRAFRNGMERHHE